MTRCVSCNRNLSDFEATRKHAVTGEYLDICNKCFKDVVGAIPVDERADLKKEESIEIEVTEDVDSP